MTSWPPQISAYASGVSQYLPDGMKSLFPGSSDHAEVVWASFDCDTGAPHRPQLVCLTYADGFKVWELVSEGQVEEVVSVLQGHTKLVCLIPSISVPEGSVLFEKQPILAVVTEDNHAFCTVKLFSLRLNKYIHTLPFRGEVYGVECSTRTLAVALKNQLFLIDLQTMEPTLTVSTYPCPNWAVLALGPRWIAYPANQPLPHGEGLGPSATYGSTLLNVSKDVADSVASGLQAAATMGMRAISNYVNPDAPRPHAPRPPGEYAGSLLVRDVKGGGILAHFRAHQQPLSSLAFDPSGMLLATAPLDGHNINIFRLAPPPPGTGAAHGVVHVYSLVRGLTSSLIQDLSFSIDSRWVAVTSGRGTTHLFAINTDGSPATTSTHVPTAPLDDEHADPLLDHMDWDADWEITSPQPQPHRYPADSPTGGRGSGCLENCSCGRGGAPSGVGHAATAVYATARVKHGVSALLPAGVAAALPYVTTMSGGGATASADVTRTQFPLPSRSAFRSYFPPALDVLHCVTQDGRFHRYKLRPFAAPAEGLRTRTPPSPQPSPPLGASSGSSAVPIRRSGTASSSALVGSAGSQTGGAQGGLALDVALECSASLPRTSSDLPPLVPSSRDGEREGPVTPPARSVSAARWLQFLTGGQHLGDSMGSVQSGGPRRRPSSADAGWLAQVEIVTRPPGGRQGIWGSPQFSISKGPAPEAAPLPPPAVGVAACAAAVAAAAAERSTTEKEQPDEGQWSDEEGAAAVAGLAIQDVGSGAAAGAGHTQPTRSPKSKATTTPQPDAEQPQVGAEQPKQTKQQKKKEQRAAVAAASQQGGAAEDDANWEGEAEEWTKAADEAGDELKLSNASLPEGESAAPSSSASSVAPHAAAASGEEDDDGEDWGERWAAEDAVPVVGAGGDAG
eukprot:CAMPEP_0114547436 /NCGR_PEP_ID=MMETSP0114-20121206/4464_1 /TAXON_ID=31324 /ORGANISM="Goniomonas sp, Strain m" /LENGTH=903 /DNA_ID=CAMNT_0001731993 /DNA_START=105 /DNA_END=2812 /DNA_ORIENTATION=+